MEVSQCNFTRTNITVAKKLTKNDAVLQQLIKSQLATQNFLTEYPISKFNKKVTPASVKQSFGALTETADDQQYAIH